MIWGGWRIASHIKTLPFIHWNIIHKTGKVQKSRLNHFVPTYPSKMDRFLKKEWVVILVLLLSFVYAEDKIVRNNERQNISNIKLKTWITQARRYVISTKMTLWAGSIPLMGRYHRLQSLHESFLKCYSCW